MSPIPDLPGVLTAEEVLSSAGHLARLQTESGMTVELSTDGVVPLSPTLDHIGPICRSVEDAAIIYDTLRGGRARAGAALDRGRRGSSAAACDRPTSSPRAR